MRDPGPLGEGFLGEGPQPSAQWESWEDCPEVQHVQKGTEAGKSAVCPGNPCMRTESEGLGVCLRVCQCLSEAAGKEQQEASALGGLVVAGGGWWRMGRGAGKTASKPSCQMGED